MPDNSQSRRIAILFADYGYGHRSASLALLDALKIQYSDQVIAEMINPIEDPSVPAFLRSEQEKYDKRVTETPQMYKLAYEIGEKNLSTTLMENAMIVMLHEALNRFIEKFQPDAIINTYPTYMAPLSAIYSLKKTRVPTITVVTDMTYVNKIWFNPSADLTTVPTEVSHDLALERGIDPDKIRITGIPVHPQIALEQRSKTEIRQEFKWKSDLTTALVVGSKRVRNIEETMHVLNHSGLPLQYVLVAGGDEQKYQAFQQTEWHHPTQIYNRVDNIPTMMHAADLIICKAGGLVTSEALGCGLPLFYVDVIQGQETGNADYIVQQGAGDLATEPIKALETMYHWLDQDGKLLNIRTKNARRIGHPNAAFDIATYAWEAAGLGPQPMEKSIFNITSLTDMMNNFQLPWAADSK